MKAISVALAPLGGSLLGALLGALALTLVIFITTLAGSPLGQDGREQVANQDNTDKRNPALLADDLPYGLVIVFAPGTTITHANHLRLDLNLILQPTAYRSTDGTSYHYAYPDDSHYAAFEKFYYARHPCAPCAPIMPTSAYYEPVTAAVAELVEASPIVQSFDNRNNRSFFLRSLLQQMINGVRAILFTRLMG